MTLAELQALLKKQGVDFNTVVNPVGPTNEWTVAEQEEDCCQEVPDADPCVGDGKKVEPWSGWTDELKQELGFTPDGPSAQELLNRAEATYGKGNVHLVVRKVGPTPCGEKVTNFVGTLGCCTNPDELVKYQGPTTVDVDDEFTFSVLSGTGEPTITWGTIGSGITVAKKSETEADGESDQCFCNPVVVYAQDSCESVAPWVVSRVGGTWSSIDDESLSSPFGWFQDGTTGSFYVTGFNDDNTKVSTQHYTQGEYIGTKEVVCGTSFPGINESPIVTPNDSQGFEQCEGASVWVRLKEGFSNVWTVRYAIDSQSSSEFTHTCQDNPLTSVNNDPTPVIADNSSAQIYWTGGESPFSVVVGGVGFYVDAGRTTNELYNYHNNNTVRSAAIYTGNACGVGYVTVTDSCGSSIEIVVRAADGQWVSDYTNPYGGVSGTFDYDTGAQTHAPREGGCPAFGLTGVDSWGYTSTGFPVTVEAGDYQMIVRMMESDYRAGSPVSNHDCNNIGFGTPVEAVISSCESLLATCKSWWEFPLAHEPGETCVSMPNYEFAGYKDGCSYNAAVTDGPRPYVGADGGVYGVVYPSGGNYRQGRASYQVWSLTIQKWEC